MTCLDRADKEYRVSNSTCLYCDCKLGFLKRFGDHKFCSDQHRDEFQKRADKRAVGRLMDAASASTEPTPNPEIERLAWHITNGFPPSLLISDQKSRNKS
jgi:hypothetical protein